ncbi:MAG: triose-phosphate isomerase [bacterium]|nr:triose-phosphate isomerase [bacterium]
MAGHPPLIVGNWKMNGTPEMAVSLAHEISDQILELQADFVLCPPFLFLPFVETALKGSAVRLGAQNCHAQAKGAFTGEISASMLKDVGCSCVILGHSERRQLFQETGQMVREKAGAALENSLTPIVCVGETLEDYEKGQTRGVLKTQVQTSLPENWSEEEVILAYEPVWAIGTGKTLTPEEVQEIHHFLKNCLEELYGQKGRDVPILYGGSVKSENASAFLSLEDVDGVLVGGASLDAKSFLDIARSVS